MELFMNKQTLIILGIIGLMIGFLGVYFGGILKTDGEQQPTWGLGRAVADEAAAKRKAGMLLQVGGGLLGILGVGMMVLGATRRSEERFGGINTRLARRDEQSGRINWKYILTYMVILFLATAAVLFPSSFLDRNAPSWLGWVAVVIHLVVMVLVFSRVAFIQRQRTAIHLVLMGLGAWLLSYPLWVMYPGIPAVMWLASIIWFFITAVAGWCVGLLLRRFMNKPHEPQE
jgi:hypothetical protein